MIFRLRSDGFILRGDGWVLFGSRACDLLRPILSKGVSISGDLGFLVPHQHVVFLLGSR